MVSVCLFFLGSKRTSVRDCYKVGGRLLQGRFRVAELGVGELWPGKFRVVELGLRVVATSVEGLLQGRFGVFESGFRVVTSSDVLGVVAS